MSLGERGFRIEAVRTCTHTALPLPFFLSPLLDSLVMVILWPVTGDCYLTPVGL